MLESYLGIAAQLPVSFSWSDDTVVDCVRNLIATRQCFIFSDIHAPAAEVTFTVSRFGADQLDVTIDAAWQPPVIEFEALENLTQEGARYVLKPRFEPYAGSFPIRQNYVVDSDWLHWDASISGFSGIVPSDIASAIGMQRSDTYTIPVKLTASISKLFPGDIRLESTIRCALPLTIKRRPEICRVSDHGLRSPPHKKSARQGVEGMFSRLSTAGIAGIGEKSSGSYGLRFAGRWEIRGTVVISDEPRTSQTLVWAA